MIYEKNQIFNQLKGHWLYSTILSLTLLFFLYKGITYAVIGSFIPLLLIVLILGLLFFGFVKSPKALRRVIGIWAALVILWSVVRLLLSIINLFVKQIPEGHVDAQLGLYGAILSMLFLFAGIYILKMKKRILV